MEREFGQPTFQMLPLCEKLQFCWVVGRRRAGTAVARRPRRAAGATSRAIADRSVSTRTGKLTTRSAAPEDRRRPPQLALAQRRTAVLPRRPAYSWSHPNRRPLTTRHLRRLAEATARDRLKQARQNGSRRNQPSVKRLLKLTD